MSGQLAQPEVATDMPVGVVLQTGGLFLVLAVGSWLAWRAYARRLAVFVGAAAVLPGVTFVEQATWLMLLPVGGLVGVVAWHRCARTSATVTRWGARVRRKSGVASSLDIERLASARSVRRSATTVRPSLAKLSRRARRKLPTTEVALQLCRVGLQVIWTSIENVILIFGGPRTGKSGWLAGRIIDAPGAVLVTSTRADLLTLTDSLRAEKGPTYVFNAVGLGGLPSTISFDPLTGCTDPVTAAERSADLIAAGSSGAARGDREYWDGQGRRVLAALMHAAALGGRSIRDVAGWVADPDSGEGEFLQMLRKSPEKGYLADATQFVATNDRTRTSITSTIMPALGWLSHPSAAAAVGGGPGFDVARMLDERATVYLLGAEETQTAPLICALTGHIAREARRLAARQPSGRLDPPLTLALDEAALISPVPLHSWTSDMGGRGVTIIAAFQSRAQLIDRYGEARAATIVTNAASKALFGGTSDRDDLNFWSTLAGERDEPIITTDLHGRVASRTVRKVPVLAPAQLAGLPRGRVVVFTKGMAPVVGRAQMAWNRADVRAALRPDALSVRARDLIQEMLPSLRVQLDACLRALRRYGDTMRGRLAEWFQAFSRRVRERAAWWRLRYAVRVAARRRRRSGLGSRDPHLGEVVPFQTPSRRRRTEPSNDPTPNLPGDDWLPGSGPHRPGEPGRWN